MNHCNACISRLAALMHGSMEPNLIIDGGWWSFFVFHFVSILICAHTWSRTLFAVSGRLHGFVAKGVRHKRRCLIRGGVRWFVPVVL